MVNVGPTVMECSHTTCNYPLEFKINYGDGSPEIKISNMENYPEGLDGNIFERRYAKSGTYYISVQSKLIKEKP